MINTDSLTDNLLVASPSLDDDIFANSVIYIYEHNEDGAIGVVLNKAMHVTIFDLLQHTRPGVAIKDKSLLHEPVLLGGAVQQQHGFILYFDQQEQKIELASSIEMLDAIAAGEGPDERVVALGYCSWEPEQLEDEILADDWLVMPAKKELLFALPVQRKWSECIKLLGIDNLNNYSSDVGNA